MRTLSLPPCDRPQPCLKASTTRARGERRVVRTGAGIWSSGKMKPFAPREDNRRTGARSGHPATLIGRRAELRTVDELIGAVAGGRSRLLQVAGEPGIGKTRLLEELAARAETYG